jgi:transposase-like protein
MSKQNGEKKRLTPSKVESVSVWKCYRCNLTFHDESTAFLHKEISNHSAVQVDHNNGRFRSINEKLGLAAETFVN